MAEYRKAITIGFFVLIGLGIVGGTFIGIFRPDASATFINMVVLVLGLATTAAISFAGINEIRKQVDQKTGAIAKNVNGNITRLIDALLEMSNKTGIPVDDVISEHTIKTIKQNSDDLVNGK